MPFHFHKKNNDVRFYGSNEKIKDDNSKNEIIVSKRLIGLMTMTALLVFILIARLAFIQLTQSENLEVQLATYSSKIYYRNAPRGKIYDRNYVELVGNQNVVCVDYYAPKSITEEEIKTIAKFLSSRLDISFERKNPNNITERNIKDYFIIAHPDKAKKLLTEEDKKEIESVDPSIKEKTKYNLELKHITMDLVNENMTHDEIEQTRFEYLMKRCKTGAVTLAEGISVEEASIIGENSNLLKGITITTDWARYVNPDYHMNGILGKLTTKRQGLPSEMKTELLAQGYSSNSRIGTSGLEQQYQNILSGTDSKYSITYDSTGTPLVKNVASGTMGDSIRISIDSELQNFSDTLIENELKSCNSFNQFFEQMYFVMMKPSNGEILVMSGKKIDKQTGEVTDISSGNYLNAVKIGSTSKAGTLYTAFKENIISPNTYFMDEPILIRGTKAKKSWKTMGNINEVDAMAWSSNVYMFRIAMKLAGCEYIPNQSLNIDFQTFVKTLSLIRRNNGELGLGVKTHLDVPNEADGYKGQSTDAGLLLDACIGQYDTYTPIQLVQYTSTLANFGKRVQPHFLIDSFSTDSNGDRVVTSTFKANILDDVSDQRTAFERIKLGMRECVTRETGTSHNYWSSKPYVAYCKTGTAEDYSHTGNVDYPNHLQIGYISATDGSEPLVAFACITVRQSKASTGADSSAPIIANQVVDKYVEKYGLN